jgi:hypothetical protein
MNAKFPNGWGSCKHGSDDPIKDSNGACAACKRTALEKISQEGSAKTCTAGELATETANGWKLVDVVHESVQQHGYQYNTNEVVNGCSQYLTKEGPPVVVSRPVFILGRSTEDEVLALRAALDAAKTAADKAAKDAEAAEKKSLTHVKLNEQSRADLEIEKSLRTQDVSKRLELETKFRLMEKDIAKLRTELGAARFREILGESS